MRTSSAGSRRRCSATSRAIAGRSRCQAPTPWTGSWRADELARPGRVVAQDAVGVHQPADDRGARLAPGGDAREHERPEPLRMADREAERRRPAHREPQEVERRQPEGVGEGTEVVDEPLVAEAVGRVPAGRGMAARVGDVAPERLAEQRQLRGEVLPPGRRRAVEEDDGRPGALDRVADVEPVGAQGGHRRRRRVSRRATRACRRPAWPWRARSAGTGAGDRAAAAPPGRRPPLASTRATSRRWSPASTRSTIRHSRTAIASSRRGIPAIPGCQAAPQKASRPGRDVRAREAVGQRVRPLAEDVHGVSARRLDRGQDEPPPVERDHDLGRIEADRGERVDRDPLGQRAVEGRDDRHARRELAHGQPEVGGAHAHRASIRAGTRYSAAP